MSELSLTRFKACTKCGCTKPATSEFFPRTTKAKSGIRAACKVCKNLANVSFYKRNPQYYEAYRQEHKATQNRYNREYQEANKERIQAQKATYYQANKERVKSRVSAYREANAEKARAAVRRWNRMHKLEKRVISRHYEASKRAAEGRHTADEVWALAESQHWLCAYCEVLLFGIYHVDHMQPLSRGGSDGCENLAITCAECNLRKGNKTAVEFILWLSY